MCSPCRCQRSWPWSDRRWYTWWPPVSGTCRKRDRSTRRCPTGKSPSAAPTSETWLCRRPYTSLGTGPKEPEIIVKLSSVRLGWDSLDVLLEFSIIIEFILLFLPLMILKLFRTWRRRARSGTRRWEDSAIEVSPRPSRCSRQWRRHCLKK